MSHSCLPNLIEISLEGCGRCEHLPPLGQLPLLEILKVSGMDSVKCIGDEFYGDHHPQVSFFPTLKQLDICKMSNLEEWHASSSQVEENRREGKELPVFPSLERLTLEGCPKLRTMPTTLSTSLKDLILGECLSTNSSVPFSLVKRVGCVQSLEIRSFDKIETLPKVLLENLSSILTFEIQHCSSLKYLPELGSRKNNSVMTRLLIQNCVGLTSVSDCLRHLTNLKDLVINGCRELEFLPDDFQDLTSLRSLTILSLPQMKSLPEGLQQVAGTIENLQLFSCPGLMSLPEWMNKFTSLRELYIFSCKNLKVLPEEVLCLTALENVLIRDCHPDLHRRYSKETGEDWHKIAHIRNVDISGTIETIRNLDIGGTIETITRKRRMKWNMVPCLSSSSSSTN